MHHKIRRFLCLGVMLLAVATAGCQLSPAQKYGPVSSPGVSPSTTLVASSTSMVSTDGPDSSWEPTRTQVGPRLAESTPKVLEGLSIDGKILSVRIEAEVRVPEAESFPVVRVEPEIIDVDEEAYLAWTGAEQISYRPDNMMSTLDIYATDTQWDTSFENLYDESDSFNCTLSRQEAVIKAQELLKALGLTDVEVYKTQAYGAAQQRGFYRVYFQHFLLGIGVTLEQRWDDQYTLAYGEQIYVLVDDQGGARIRFAITRITEVLEENPLLLNMEEALESLRRNLDFVIATQTQYAISRIELGYVPTQYSEGRGTAVYRPAWIFSSGDNFNTNREFVAWIDAVTGQLIQ